nr:hypothetical protein GCM10017547_27320 [Pseudarthrobacter oxydans]
MPPQVGRKDLQALQQGYQAVKAAPRFPPGVQKQQRLRGRITLYQARDRNAGSEAEPADL